MATDGHGDRSGTFMAQRAFFHLSPFVLVAGLSAAATLPAGAVETAPQVEWLCTQGGDEAYSVVCVPVPGESVAAERDDPTARPAAASRPPRDLRPVAMRGSAEIFGVDAWHVPLYGPPTDPEGVRELLHAVLCGRVVDCTVRYQENDPVFAPQARLR